MWTNAALVAALCIAGLLTFTEALAGSGTSSFRDQQNGTGRWCQMNLEYLADDDDVPNELGCYTEGSIRIDGFQAEFPKGLTPDRCKLLCFNKAFRYAATFNGSTCLCGDLPEGKADRACNKICSSPCSGDSTRKCGGPSAYSLIDTDLKEVADDYCDNIEVEVGCIEDSDDDRVFLLHKQDLTLTNTPKKCVEYCRSLGFWNAGVKNSFECHCGDATRIEPIVKGCDQPCVGDEDQACGGNGKINVYRTGIDINKFGYLSGTTMLFVKNDGCAIISEKSFHNFTDRLCAAYCFREGFMLAHLNNTSDCLCANVNIPTRPSEIKEVEPKLCTVTCVRKNQETCESKNITYMYSNEIVGKLSAGKLKGCFLDTHGTLLKGPTIDLGENNSPDTCIAKCIELEHGLAGLRNRTECHCGDQDPERHPVRIRPDAQCAEPCPGDPTQNCGTLNRISVYRTGHSYDLRNEGCVKSTATVNGKKKCRGTLVLEEHFNELDPATWKLDVKFSGPDNEFVTYFASKTFVFIKNGKLVIFPALLTDEDVYGSVQLNNCQYYSLGCEKTAKSFHIVPPVGSGRICTKLNFKYGTVTVRAKFPKGDWVVPEISLNQNHDSYGWGLRSGRIIVARAFGNKELRTDDNNDIGSKLVKSGFQVETTENVIKERMRSIESETPWNDGFHNYSLKWTQDLVEFYVDDDLKHSVYIYKNTGLSLAEEMGFNDELSRYKWGSNIAPFDKEFHICLGVSVGGFTAFPDNSSSSGKPKPWKNYRVKAMVDFWKARNEWFSTWSEDTKMEVDYLSVTSG